jgi:ribokinase
MSGVPDIVVVGSHGVGQVMRVDHFPAPGETVRSLSYDVAQDGGKASNQAVAIGRLGCSAAFVGIVGRDMLGDLGDRWMTEAGVDTSHLLRSETKATSTGIVVVDAQGMNSIIDCDGPEDELAPADVEPCIRDLAGARVLLTCFEIPVQTALFAARLGHELGMATILNPAPAPDVEMGTLEYVDVFVPNEHEAREIVGDDGSLAAPQLAEAVRRICRSRSVIVTLGAEGSAGLDADGPWSAAPRTVPVVDTTGAGDAYCAALACGLVRGMGLREAGRWAGVVAAISVSRAGSMPSFPTLDEVEAALGTASS